MEERLTVRIGANISDFESKMSRMQGKMDSVGKNMSSIGSSMTKYITAPAAGAIAAAGGIVAAFGWKRLVGLDSAQAQLKGLGYEVKDVERISDQVNNAVQGTTMTMAEGTSVAAGALAAGVDEGEELEAYIKAVGNAAVGSGREVGEMASIFNRVQGSGKLMTQELNMIEDGMPGFAQAMADSMGVGMEEFRKMVTAGEVSSEDFLTVMDDFAGDMSEAYANSWEGMVANTKAWIGILGENLLGGVFEHSKDSIGEFMELLKSDAAQEWATEMGAKIGDGFGRIIDTVKSVVNWWNELSGTTQKVIGVLAGLVVAAGPVLMVVGKIVQVVASLAPLLKIVGVVIGALTSPVGLVVAAIAALGAAFVLAYNKSETFRNFIDGLKDKFLNAWESAMEFKDKVVDAFNGILAIFKGDDTAANELLRGIGLSEENIDNVFLAVTKIQNFFGDMKEGIQTALDGISNFFVEQFEGIRAWWDSDGTMILSAISTAFEWTMDAISDAVKFGLDLVVSLFETFAPIVEGIWNILWPTIVYLTQTAWENIKLVVGIAMDLVQGIISGVAAIIEGDWSRFGQVLADTAQSIWNRVIEFFGNMKDRSIELFSQLVESAKEWFLDMWSNVTDRARQIKDDVTNRITEMKDNAISRVTELFNSVTGWFTDLWSDVTSTARDLKNAVTDRFTEIKDNTIGRISDAYDSVTTKFSSMRDSVSTTARNLKTNVTNRFTEAKDNAISRSKAMFNGVTGWYDDTFGDVTGTVDEIKENVTNRFNDAKDNAIAAAKSMWTGTTEWFDDIKDDATELFDNMVDGAKELPGRIGDAIKNMASKAVDGVKELGNKMAGKLGDVVDGVTGGLNKILDKIGVSSLIPDINIPTFSTGTRGGAIANDMLGMVNDRGPGNGAGGATQELIKRDGQLFAPRGRDAIVPLKKGDEILNGKQTQSLMSSGIIPRFSQGTGTEGGDSGKKGLLGTLQDVVSNVWSYISDPGKAFDALMDSVSPDFSGFSGFGGKLLSGGFSMITNGIKSFISKIFKENEGALGSGKKGSFMNYRMTTPYSPNRPVPGYPAGFNGGRHYGIDYATPVGTPVHATMGGQLSSFWNTGGGLIAKLVTGQLRQFFMHMQSVAPAGSVAQGDVIGRTGNSGAWTTGPHVHWQAQQGSDALNVNTISPLKVINGYSNGGIVSKRQFAEIAEDGPEAIIPLSSSKRGRANQLYDAVGGRIGRDDNKHYDRMINNQQTQIDQMTQAINVLLGIEDKSGFDPGKANKAINKHVDDRTLLL